MSSNNHPTTNWAAVDVSQQQTMSPEIRGVSPHLVGSPRTPEGVSA